ncbi:hypothetical protein F4861DRAFT_220940 [Xylaria intraflava]|nr:hypothetical protein F4861DRAFT_220940 [Xylaria intraflava]
MAADLAATEKAQKALLSDELRAQRIRWAQAGAYTNEQQILTCMHSSVCEKLTQQKKFKCGVCSMKRGRIAFECPHCGVLLCQLCLNEFSLKRKHAGVPAPQGQPEPQGEAEGRSGYPGTAQFETDSTQNNAKDTQNQNTAEGSRGKSQHRARGAGNNGDHKPLFCLTCLQPGHSAPECPRAYSATGDNVSNNGNHSVADDEADAHAHADAHDGGNHGKRSAKHGKRGRKRH